MSVGNKAMALRTSSCIGVYRSVRNIVFCWRHKPSSTSVISLYSYSLDTGDPLLPLSVEWRVLHKVSSEGRRSQRGSDRISLVNTCPSFCLHSRLISCGSEMTREYSGNKVQFWSLPSPVRHMASMALIPSWRSPTVRVSQPYWKSKLDAQ